MRTQSRSRVKNCLLSCMAGIICGKAQTTEKRERIYRFCTMYCESSVAILFVWRDGCLYLFCTMYCESLGFVLFRGGAGRGFSPLLEF